MCGYIWTCLVAYTCAGSVLHTIRVSCSMFRSAEAAVDQFVYNQHSFKTKSMNGGSLYIQLEINWQ